MARYIVLNVNSSHDYKIEAPFFNLGNPRWPGTKDGCEKINDRFGFVDFRKKTVEIFNIEDIKEGSEARAYIRPEWSFEEAQNRSVLILSPKLGEISYNYLCEVTKTNGGKGVAYNPNHPLRGTTRRSYNEIAEKGLVDVAKISESYIEVDCEMFREVRDERKGLEEGYLYFIYEEQPFSKNLDGEDVFFVKVGFTINLVNRMRAHQCGNPRKLTLRNSIRCVDYKNAERYMHRYFRDRRSTIGGGTEWFMLSLNEIDSICDASQSK